MFVRDERIHQICMGIIQDSHLQTTMNTVKTELPDVALNIREYWPFRDDVTTVNGLLSREIRMMIPITMQTKNCNANMCITYLNTIHSEYCIYNTLFL